MISGDRVSDFSEVKPEQPLSKLRVNSDGIPIDLRVKSEWVLGEL